MVRMKYNPTLSIIITFFVGIKWIISSSDEYLFLSQSTTTEEIPQIGWRVRNEAGWEDDDTLNVTVPGKLHSMSQLKKYQHI